MLKPFAIAAIGGLTLAVGYCAITVINNQMSIQQLHQELRRQQAWHNSSPQQKASWAAAQMIFRKSHELDEAILPQAEKQRQLQQVAEVASVELRRVGATGYQSPFNMNAH